MSDVVMVGALSLIGTAIGSGVSILINAKLTNYRIEQLEKKMDKYNNLKDRMIEVESSTKSAHHRIDELRVSP